MEAIENNLTPRERELIEEAFLDAKLKRSRLYARWGRADQRADLDAFDSAVAKVRRLIANG